MIRWKGFAKGVWRLVFGLRKIAIEEKGGATFVVQTKVTADSNLERFAAQIQVCCCAA